MKHYFCTITFNNATNKSLKEVGGMRFYVRVLAENKEHAKTITELTAKNIWNNIFTQIYLENADVCTYEDGVKGEILDIYPVSTTPRFVVEVKEDELVSSFGDAHDDRLRKAINEIWANDDYRESLKLIVRAYFERDCEEIANFYSNECVYWRATELSFNEFLNVCNFASLCEMMFSHILDDEDYRAIINFIRPKLSFVENWWEL